MTILSLILACYRRLIRSIRQAQTYAELRQLDEATLKDIGLRLENGRVVENYRDPAITEPESEICQQESGR